MRFALLPTHPAKARRRDTGSVLVAIIIGMTIVASLGGAMMQLYATSETTQIGSIDSAKAYYLAEAGGRYVIQEIVKLEYDGTSSYANGTELSAALNGQTMTFDDGSQFQLAVSYSDPTYTVDSTGIPTPGMTRKITYEVTVQ